MRSVEETDSPKVGSRVTDPYVLLVTGPAGAGKTVVARQVASAAPHPAAHVSLDDVQDWLQTGAHDPAGGWSQEREAQHDLARAICADAARRYHAHGISTVIDDLIFPRRETQGLEGWLSDLALPAVHLAVLLPQFDSVSARNRLRSRQRRVTTEMLQMIYDSMAPWGDLDGVFVVDNTDLSVEATADRLRELTGAVRPTAR